jgi:hypothetical protein
MCNHCIGFHFSTLSAVTVSAGYPTETAVVIRGSANIHIHTLLSVVQDSLCVRHGEVYTRTSGVDSYVKCDSARKNQRKLRRKFLRP